MSGDSEAYERSIALVTELEGQTDRGASIVGAAWVEEEVTAALQSYLQNDKRSWDRLFGRNSPLGTFSPKIDLVRLLGMCSSVIASDLHILREVRNEFAHSILSKDHVPLSFGLSHIRDKCMALQCIKHENSSEPRVAFIRACAMLTSDFYLHRYLGQKVEGGGMVFAKVERGV